MKKTNYFLILFFLFIFIHLFSTPNINYIIIDSCTIWLNNLVPSILPFYILTDLLTNYGFVNTLNRILEKPLFFIFKIKGSSIFVFIFSMLTGFPSSAKYIKSLLKEDLISVEEANRIIRFCHFSNPLFIINIIGTNILGNRFLGILILMSHFFSNFIIAFIFRNKSNKSIYFKDFQQKTFSTTLSNSIINTFNSLLIILGNLITFQLFKEIIFEYLDFGQDINAIINGIIEITSGVFALNKSSFNIYLKALIITSAISFGGFCIHSQVYGILSNTKVKYRFYLEGRIMQAIIAPLILLILLLCCRV